MTKQRRPYKTYTREFKREALRLMETTDRPASEIAMELGIRRNQLYKWKEQLARQGDKAFSGSCRPKAEGQSELTLLRQEIERIKVNGFAVDNQEFHEDVRCLAAPVRDANGKAIAAIGITGPAMQFTEEKKVEFGCIVKQSADALSTELGYHPSYYKGD